MFQIIKDENEYIIINGSDKHVFFGENALTECLEFAKNLLTK